MTSRREQRKVHKAISRNMRGLSSDAGRAADNLDAELTEDARNHQVNRDANRADGQRWTGGRGSKYGQNPDTGPGW